MKKLIILVLMLTCAFIAQAQTVVRQGNTFTQAKVTHKADTLVTVYTFEDSKSNQYPIIINKSTGSCYVWRTSRNGKTYKSYMKPEVSQQIANELGIIYKPRNRQ